MASKTKTLTKGRRNGNIFDRWSIVHMCSGILIFGFESIRNSLSDIVFDAIGVAIGAYILGELLSPPIHLL